MSRSRLGSVLASSGSPSGWKRRHVGVSERESQYDSDAGVASGGSSHPERVVVAPLDVEVVACQQVVHDDVCSRSAVEDVAQDVQLVDAQLVYDVADGHDEVACLPCLNDGFDDASDVSLLVVVARVLVEKFLYDVGKLRGQGFAHLAAGVFAAHRPTDLYELHQGSCVVVGEVVVGSFLYHFESLLGVVDEGAEVAHHVVGERLSEEVAHLSLDVAAGVSQDVEEGFVLSVYVGHEVFRAFRQAEDGFEVDDFGAGAFAVGESLR